MPMKRLQTLKNRRRSSELLNGMASRPAHHANDAGTAFVNPWPSAKEPTWAERQQFAFPLSWYKPRGEDNEREVKVVDPDWGASSLKKQGLQREQSIIGTWLGHAAALIELPLEGTAGDKKKKSLWMLFDPIFSNRAGPTQYVGPTRFNKSPCQVKDLPGCDVVFISHNHYDHLDYLSVEALFKKFPKVKFFAGLGNKAWFASCGIPKDSIYELDWWGIHTSTLHDFGLAQASEEVVTRLQFTCVPAQHNSGRTVLDSGTTLWCGWVVEQFIDTEKKSRKGAIYHAGDTGYRPSALSKVTCPVFKEFGEKFGPFDLSFIPIWRGGTLGFVSHWGLKLDYKDIPAALHASPADAVAIHKDVRSLNTIGMHWGTFVGSEDEQHEAWKEFRDSCAEHGVGNLEDEKKGDGGRAGTLNIGEGVAVEMA